MRKNLQAFALLLITATTACTTKSILKSYLFSVNCEQPCWLGMSPQITTSTEVETILKSHIKDENGDVIKWEWSQKLNHTGLILLDDNNTIGLMSVSFAKDQIKLTELINLLSEPDYVLVIPNWSDTTKSQCLDAMLIFVDSHILVSLYDSVGNVTSKYSIARLEFHSPSNSSLPWWNSYDSIVHEWNGYKDYCYGVP